jgi:hypothetical protein
MILIFVVFSVGACTSASADPFAAKIKSGRFSKKELVFADKIVSFVYGENKEKILKSDFHSFEQNINYGKKCLNNYLISRLIHNGKFSSLSDSSFGYNFDVNFQNRNPNSDICYDIETRFDKKRDSFDEYNNREPQLELRGFNGSSIVRKLFRNRIWVHALDKNTVYLPTSIGNFVDYKKGFFARSKNCSLKIDDSDPKLRNSVIIFGRLDDTTKKSVSIVEEGIPGNPQKDAESEQLAISLAKNVDFVECYMRGQLVALGMDGGATVPRNLVMSERLKGSGTYCDVAAEMSNDVKVGLSCRIPAREIAFIYAVMLVDFPGERRMVSRNEFKFEVLETLTRIDDSSNQ